MRSRIARSCGARHRTSAGSGPCGRAAPDWRPFSGALSARSAATLSVLGALFRWLIEQRYLANPFAGVRCATRAAERTRHVASFTEGEWLLVRTIADESEFRGTPAAPQSGWTPAAAQRLRFILDFGYATGLRASELVGATLGDIETDAHGDAWLKVIGKGSKAARVALPPLRALDRFLVARRLPVTPSRWRPDTPLIPSLAEDGAAAITSVRLWKVMQRFFAQTADQVDADNPRSRRNCGRQARTGCVIRIDARVGAWRGVDDRARQPAPCVDLDDVDLPAWRRREAGAADVERVRGRQVTATCGSAPRPETGRGCNRRRAAMRCSVVAGRSITGRIVTLRRHAGEPFRKTRCDAFALLVVMPDPDHLPDRAAFRGIEVDAE